MSAHTARALLAPHLRRGIGTSILVAVLVALTVLVVAVAPRASALLGTAELRHEFTEVAPGSADLVGLGRIGLLQEPVTTPVTDLVGATDRSLAELPSRLPSPLADATGETAWVVRTNPAVASMAAASTTVVTLRLAVDLDWESRVTLLEGRTPAPWVAPESAAQKPEPMEVAISSTAASNLGVEVGDEIGFLPAPLRVAEIYEATDPDETYWTHARDLLRGAVINEQGSPPKVQASVYLAPQSLVSLQTQFGEGELAAWVPIDPNAWDYADRADLLVQARNATATPFTLPDYGLVTFRSGIVDVVEATQAKVSASTALIALSSSGFLGVLLATYALSIQALIRRRAPALSLLEARGATRGQLRLLMVIEAAIIAVPATVLATVLAAVFVPARIGPEGWLAPLLIGCIPVVLAAVLLRPGSFREGRRDLGGRGPLRWVVEVAVIALAALALLLLQRRGLVESSAAVGVDPLLAAAPVLVAAAVGLLVLRLYPLPLRAIHSAARRRAVPAVSLGSARAIREPAVGVVAILALVVGMSMVVFTAVMVSTVGASILQSAADQVGADVRVSAHDIPDSLVSEIADLPAVADAVSLVSKSGVDFTDESGPVGVTVVLADTELLNRIRPDIPRLGGKSDGAIPVLISDDWDSQIDGTELSLVNSNVVEAGTIATGALPGMSRHWLLVDISAADELGLAGQSPYAILASLTDPDDGRGPVADEIEALVAAAQPAQFAGSLRVETAAALADQMSTAPVVGAVQLALVVVAAGTLLLTALVVALATAAAAALRGRVLGVVRVLGMSRRQVAALTAWELAPAAIASLAVAAGLGIAIPYIVLAALDLRGFFGGNLAPVPTVDPVLLGLAVGVFVAVVVVASGAATVIGRRAAPARTIRMGE